MGYLYLERYISRTRNPLSANRRINNKKVASEGRERFFNINLQFIIPRGWNKSSSLICFYGWHCLIWPFFLGFLKKYVIIENKRRWWNGRHACFRRMCPYGCEGSNPFLRIKSNPINHDRIFSYYGEEGYCSEKLGRSGLQLNISLMDSH